MTGLFRRLVAGLKARQRQRAVSAVSSITARYQIFRSLLDSNTQAVELITDLDWRLRPSGSPGVLKPKVSRLIDITADMAEKLNILDIGGHELLFAVHHRIAGQIRQLIEQLPTPPPLPFCLPLSAIRPQHRAAVGGKAASLASLKNEAGLPVPDGFAITARACRSFLEQNNLFLRLTGILRRESSGGDFPADAVEAVKQSILGAPLPSEFAGQLREAALSFFSNKQTLAVRSSALAEDGRRHSFAGQFSTVLNVVDQSALEQAFRQVVASAYGRRSLSYRQHAGLDPFDFDMAVLCLQMVKPKAAGILLTRSPLPEHNGMLISAVFGLGEAAVAGSEPADLYVLDPQGKMDEDRSVIATKQNRLVCLDEGGIGSEPLPREKSRQQVLNEAQVATLAAWGLSLEKASGVPQDLEWAGTEDDRLFVLQARPLVSAGSPAGLSSAAGPVLLDGGIMAAGGQATGRVHLVRRRDDLQNLPSGPVILVMHQSLVDAVAVIDKIAGLLIELGNPADHLALVARESVIPMLCGLAALSGKLTEGQWVTIDGNSGTVHLATDEAIATASREAAQTTRLVSREPPPDPLIGALRQLIVPLNLTDAFGPTFTIRESKSLHDIVRYVHEKGVLAMFEAGDQALEKGGKAVHILQSEVPFLLHIIDLGGGLTREAQELRRISPSAILSIPFKALWEGISTPDLHWGPPPGGVNMGSVMSNWLTDHKSARPIGMPNYAIISRDYFNLNARMDFHFAMIDSVCGLDSRSNYLRFRFKGGGTSIRQRQRRALCIARILEEHGFYTDVQDDLINASLQGVAAEIITDKLVVLGRLLGFTRLLDAVMGDDRQVELVAKAFLEGDYALKSLASSDAKGQRLASRHGAAGPPPKSLDEMGRET
jgi:pyruvate,water dikinase